MRHVNEIIFIQGMISVVDRHTQFEVAVGSRRCRIGFITRPASVMATSLSCCGKGNAMDVVTAGESQLFPGESLLRYKDGSSYRRKSRPAWMPISRCRERPHELRSSSCVVPDASRPGARLDPSQYEPIIIPLGAIYNSFLYLVSSRNA